MGQAVLYLLLSALLSGVIGLEREWRNKAAGFRTHVLVGMGTTLLTILSIHGFPDGDPSRIAAQVVTGIGFIGAGVILHRGVLVRGLTTASTLWMTMAIGMAVGVGWIAIALIATGFALAALLFLTYISYRLPAPDHHRVYLDVLSTPDQAPGLQRILEEAHAVMRRGEWGSGSHGPRMRLRVTLLGITGKELMALLARLSEAGATEVTWNSTEDDVA